MTLNNGVIINTVGDSIWMVCHGETDIISNDSNAFPDTISNEVHCRPV